MKKAELVQNGNEQTVRLPKEFQFSEKDVLIHRFGDAVILFPKNRTWEVFLHGLNSFSDDFMEDVGEKEL